MYVYIHLNAPFLGIKKAVMITQYKVWHQIVSVTKLKKYIYIYKGTIYLCVNAEKKEFQN